jgi:SAM-dependent methyltransferase
MSQMLDYYRSSDSYAEVLRNQPTAMFTPYVNLFKRFVKIDDSVIDVGCGVGTSTLLLRQAGFAAQGSDVSQKFLSTNDESDIFCVADFQNAQNIPSNHYAAVGSMNAIEHVQFPQKFLQEMVRVVKPGGHIILMAPNLTSPLVAIRATLDIFRNRTPYMGITNWRETIALIFVNIWRCLRAELGVNAFKSREIDLATVMVGNDADAVYWTNATEISRFLQAEGCEICLFQKQGTSVLAKIVAYLLPGFAGKLCIVARKKKT